MAEIVEIDPEATKDAKLTGVTAALNVSLNKLAAEYFGISESIGLAPGGRPAQMFFEALGRLSADIADQMLDSGIKANRGTLVEEYLSAIYDGAYVNRDSRRFPKLN